jgi:hypothetical protein
MPVNFLVKWCYKNNFGEIEEVFFDKEDSVNVLEYNKLEMEPYGSKVFIIKS